MKNHAGFRAGHGGCMRYATISGFLILFGFLGLGEALSAATGLPIPGSVLGMLLLTAGLLSGVVREEWVARMADGLLDHLGLLFVPPGVGVMLHFDLIGREWLPMVVTVLASTAAVLAVTGWITAALVRRVEERDRA